MVMPADTQILPEDVARITVDQFDKMIARGVFDEDERMELLDGMLFKVSPHGDRHARAIVRINKILVRAVGDHGDVAPQVPFRATHLSRPEPDLAVWPRANDRDPIPPRPLLVIEIAETSLRHDRLTKGPLYARAAVPEYWIVDLNGDAIEVYTAPSEDGYLRTAIYRRGDEILTVALPLQFRVDELLPSNT